LISFITNGKLPASIDLLLVYPVAPNNEATVN